MKAVRPDLITCDLCSIPSENKFTQAIATVDVKAEGLLPFKKDVCVKCLGALGFALKEWWDNRNPH